MHMEPKTILQKPTKVVMIHCMTEAEDYTQYAVDEGVSLLDTYMPGLKVEPMRFNINKVSARTFLTKGRIERVQQYIEEHKPDFVFWNHNINHRHQRALETEFNIPVYDRIKIILEIFQARAKSSEEKLRVALAYKEYQRSRVTHAWSHLERQRGGMSKVGGPGEKQLELDKRMIDSAIDTYKRKLLKVATSRDVRRSSRANMPMIAIVGYTNVGKTTLFNLLTKSNDLAEDKLFATLDPHTRRAFLPQVGTVLMSDTVGFIRNFPASLKNAFASTLEEIKYAKLILHVHNAMMPLEHKYAQEVINILKYIGADHIPIIDVWNKCDIPENDVDIEDDTCAVKISCKTGAGINVLKEMMQERILSIELGEDKIDEPDISIEQSYDVDE